jgi:ribosome-associated protein
MQYEIEGEYIELYKLLKLLDLVDSGGQAKLLIAEGHVYRNGEVETRKRAKIEPGETIQIADLIIETE